MKRFLPLLSRYALISSLPVLFSSLAFAGKAEVDAAVKAKFFQTLVRGIHDRDDYWSVAFHSLHVDQLFVALRRLAVLGFKNVLETLGRVVLDTEVQNVPVGASRPHLHVKSNRLLLQILRQFVGLVIG